MNMKFTKHQVARGTRPDAETFDKFFLIKKASELRATYQIRLLAYRAVEEKRKLIIDVPKNCKIASDLKELMKNHPKIISIMRS